MSRKTLGWTLLIVANVLVISVLSLDRPTDAAPPSPRPPFANSVEQRGKMIRELQEIKALMQEQNALLRSLATPEKPDVSNQRR